MTDLNLPLLYTSNCLIFSPCFPHRSNAWQEKPRTKQAQICPTAGVNYRLHRLL